MANRLLPDFREVCGRQVDFIELFGIAMYQTLNYLQESKHISYFLERIPAAFVENSSRKVSQVYGYEATAKSKTIALPDVHLEKAFSTAS